MVEKEDMHFLIDSAPPVEVERALTCLDRHIVYSTEELRKKLLQDWEYSAQRNLTFSTRRLFDLGLAGKGRTSSGKAGHTLTELGAKVREILSLDHELYAEIMHYLHYDGYDGTPSSRKLFWSYRTCCEIIWTRKQTPPTAQMVAEVQSRIADLFPTAYASRVGGNFNAGGVSSGWKPWVAQLTPSPLASEGRGLTPRRTYRSELAALAMDHVYRSRGYRYGDPVIIDEPLINELAGIFFLNLTCCRELVDMAARVTGVIELSDTLAGTAVTLVAPYGIERI